MLGQHTASFGSIAVLIALVPEGVAAQEGLTRARIDRVTLELDDTIRVTSNETGRAQVRLSNANDEPIAVQVTGRVTEKLGNGVGSYGPAQDAGQTTIPPHGHVAVDCEVPALRPGEYTLQVEVRPHGEGADHGAVFATTTVTSRWPLCWLLGFVAIAFLVRSLHHLLNRDSVPRRQARLAVADSFEGAARLVRSAELGPELRASMSRTLAVLEERVRDVVAKSRKPRFQDALLDTEIRVFDAAAQLVRAMLQLAVEAQRVPADLRASFLPKLRKARLMLATATTVSELGTQLQPMRDQAERAQTTAAVVESIEAVRQSLHDSGIDPAQVRRVAQQLADLRQELGQAESAENVRTRADLGRRALYGEMIQAFSSALAGLPEELRAKPDEVIARAVARSAGPGNPAVAFAEAAVELLETVIQVVRKALPDPPGELDELRPVQGQRVRELLANVRNAIAMLPNTPAKAERSQRGPWTAALTVPEEEPLADPQRDGLHYDRMALWAIDALALTVAGLSTLFTAATYWETAFTWGGWLGGLGAVLFGLGFGQLGSTASVAIQALRSRR